MNKTIKSNKILLRVCSLLCCIVLLCINASVCVYAEESNTTKVVAAAETNTILNTKIRNKDLIQYHEYYNNIENNPIGEDVISIPAADFTKGNASALAASFEGKNNVLLLSEDKGEFVYNFSVKKEGLYRIEADYFPIANDSVLDINLVLKLDGKLPFKEAENIFLSKIYSNETEIKQDEHGDDIRPKQVERPEWYHTSLIDNSGYNPNHFVLYLTAGTHTLSIMLDQESIALEKLTLNGNYGTKSYKEVKAEYKEKGYKQVKGDVLVFQAETAEKKSTLSAYPFRDGSNAALTPSSPKNQKLNIISTGKPCEWLTWKVTPKKSGLYGIGFRATQTGSRGMFNTRRLYINGEVPFNEVNFVEFPYSSKWYNHVLGGDEEYLFYFEEGKEYEITLECTTGRFSETLQVVQKAVSELNDLNRRITMVTGMSPDIYRDYDLAKQIPDLNDSFKKIRDDLKNELKRLDGIMDVEGSELVTVEDIIRQLNNFIKDQRSIPSGLASFRTNVGSLGTWMLTMTNQYVSFDELYLITKNSELEEPNAGFFAQFWHECKAVVYSFIDDYEEDTGRENIDVWATAGRDQLNIIRRLVDDEFSSQEKIDVDLSIVPDSATLLQATLAGKGPDIAMFVEKTLPVNLAARGALVCLDDFPEYKEVSQRFYPSALIPYTFDGKNYAVPNSHSFNLLFCRDDIFEELDIEVPQTWDEFYKVLPIIQRSNMQVGIGVDSQVGTVGDARLIFETLILQKGGQFFNDDLTATAFDTPEVLDAFKMWTGFYTEYELSLVYDVFNYFRSGVMPMAIADYTQYNQFAVAAPEIKGLWSIHPIPGTVMEDGSINRIESSQGTASIIMNSTEHKEAAFKFLDWWSTENTQTRFSRDLEATMGPAARYATANVKALKNLAWNPEEYKTISEQWKQVTDIPSIPSSYYVTRNVTNIFRNVVYNNENERETLNKYAEIIDKEITRKNKELGID